MQIFLKKLWSRCNAFLGSLEHNHAHTTRTRTAMSSNSTLGVETRAHKRQRERDAPLGEAIPGLPNHLVATNVLRSEYFDDPADPARLTAVSRAMRDTMAETGLRFKEIHVFRATELGCLSTVQRMQRRGRLSFPGFPCMAAARSG